MIVIGGILIVAGSMLFVMYFRSKTRLQEMSAAENYTAASLQDIWKGVAEEIGTGSFEQAAEVNGVIECDQPLTSEIGKQACVHYRMSVEREYEEDYEEEYTERDSATGEDVKKTRRGTRKGSDSVSSNTRSTRFMVRDNTGTILVDPDGANIDVEQVVDRFEPHTSSGGTISFKGFSFSVGAAADSARRRTLGYRFREWILPPGKNVYILGAASDRTGELLLQKPREKGKFLISLKSEEELMASAKSGMTWGLYGSIVCFILGVLFVIIHLIQ